MFVFFSFWLFWKWDVERERKRFVWNLKINFQKINKKSKKKTIFFEKDTENNSCYILRRGFKNLILFFAIRKTNNSALICFVSLIQEREREKERIKKNIISNFLILLKWEKTEQFIKYYVPFFLSHFLSLGLFSLILAWLILKIFKKV